MSSKRAPGFTSAGSRAVHFRIATVGDRDPPVGVEQRDAMGQVFEQRGEPGIEHRQIEAPLDERGFRTQQASEVPDTRRAPAPAQSRARIAPSENSAARSRQRARTERKALIDIDDQRRAGDRMHRDQIAPPRPGKIGSQIGAVARAAPPKPGRP